jgi:hypothetical protein
VQEVADASGAVLEAWAPLKPMAGIRQAAQGELHYACSFAAGAGPAGGVLSPESRPRRPSVTDAPPAAGGGAEGTPKKKKKGLFRKVRNMPSWPRSWASFSLL